MGGFYLLVYTFFLFSKIDFRPVVIKNAVLILSAFLIFFSFSKGALVPFLLINFFYVFLHFKKSTCSFCLLSRVFGLFVLAFLFLSASTDVHSIGKRIELASWAVSLVKSNPLFGVGIGTFVSAAKQFKSDFPYVSPQPVHNIFLLMLSEVGVVVTGTITYFFSKFILIYRKNTAMLACLFVIAFTGMFDHYWLTLQQNWLVIGVLIGVLTNRRYLS